MGQPKILLLGMEILRDDVVNYTPLGAYVAIKTIFQLTTDFYTENMMDVEPVTAITMTLTSLVDHHL